MQIYNKTTDQMEAYENGSWGAMGGGLANIVEDTTPQLGGDLDVNTHSIVSASDNNIPITPQGTGRTIIAAPSETVTSKSGVATLAVAEAGIVLVSAAAGYTLTLPTAVGNAGLRYHFIKTDANYNLITLAANGAQTFNYPSDAGAAQTTYPRLNTYCAEVTVVSDGANWQCINERLGQAPECFMYMDNIMSAVTDNTYVRVDLLSNDYNIGDNFINSNWESGSATSTSAGHLVDTNASFTAAMVGKYIRNTTDVTATYITALNSGTDVSVRDDIFVDTENYEIKHSKFIVPVTGKYPIVAVIEFTGVIADKRYYTAVYVNGIGIDRYSCGIHASLVGNVNPNFVETLSLDKDDYIELFGNAVAGANTVSISATRTVFIVRLVSKE